MPMPYTYRHAQAEFAAFLRDAREAMALDSDNMTYTAVDGVFQTFRRRLTVPQALAFADLLPAILRAMFLWRWTPAPPLPFADRATLTAEAQSLRPHHNLTPANCIEATALALRGQIGAADLDRLLADFPQGAAEFWALPPGVPAPALRFG